MASNYRPVSLTSIIGKCLEKIVCEKIIEIMKDNSLFNNREYGFISGSSIQLQLLEVLDKWTEVLDEGQSIDCIYINNAKALIKEPSLQPRVEMIQTKSEGWDKVPARGWRSDSSQPEVNVRVPVLTWIKCEKYSNLQYLFKKYCANHFKTIKMVAMLQQFFSLVTV